MAEVQPSEILEEAIDVLDRQGWCQNTLVNASREVCAVGAIDFAQRDLQDDKRMKNFTEISRKLESMLGGSIAYWNDSLTRTKDEVQDLLMQGAKHFRNIGR